MQKHQAKKSHSPDASAAATIADPLPTCGVNLATDRRPMTASIVLFASAKDAQVCDGGTAVTARLAHW